MFAFDGKLNFIPLDRDHSVSPFWLEDYHIAQLNFAPKKCEPSEIGANEAPHDSRGTRLPEIHEHHLST